MMAQATRQCATATATMSALAFWGLGPGASGLGLLAYGLGVRNSFLDVRVGLCGFRVRLSGFRVWACSLGHFQVGSYRYRSLTEGLSIFLIKAF